MVLDTPRQLSRNGVQSSAGSEREGAAGSHGHAVALEAKVNEDNPGRV